ncbi:MAG: alpha-glucosidase C-terminal domain-containing protein, partial [Umezawaea sp.]
ARVLGERPQPPRDAHWATFVRNHDELTLDKLTEYERKEVFEAFGPDPEMQLYDRGLRRRLPSMLDGDQRRIRMVYSLLFSLPGTPVLFYGEEIGMAENLKAEGRLAVRTPMQWDAGPNGGFSTAPAKTLPGPVVEGQFSPKHVNVDTQHRDPNSLLSWIRLLVERYRDCPELAWGKFQVLKTDEPAVLAHRCDDDGTIVAVHNFGEEEVTITLPLKDFSVAEDQLVDGRVKIPKSGNVKIPLEPYGCRWFRLT